MARRKQKTQKEVVTALIKCGGIISKAAEMLGLASASSLRTRIKNDPKLSEAWDYVRMDILDKAEDNIVTAIKDGDKDVSKWYLAKMGRERGYGEALEISGSVTVNKTDLSNLSEEELANLEAIIRKTTANSTGS